MKEMRLESRRRTDLLGLFGLCDIYGGDEKKSVQELNKFYVDRYRRQGRKKRNGGKLQQSRSPEAEELKIIEEELPNYDILEFGKAGNLIVISNKVNAFRHRPRSAAPQQQRRGAGATLRDQEEASQNPGQIETVTKQRRLLSNEKRQHHWDY